MVNLFKQQYFHSLTPSQITGTCVTPIHAHQYFGCFVCLNTQYLLKKDHTDMSLLAPIQHRSAKAQTDLLVIRGRDALVPFPVGFIVSSWLQVPFLPSAAFLAASPPFLAPCTSWQLAAPVPLRRVIKAAARSLTTGMAVGRFFQRLRSALCSA